MATIVGCGSIRTGSTGRPRRMLAPPAVDDSRSEIGLRHPRRFLPMIAYVCGMSLMDNGLTRAKAGR